jgi:peptide/nickel transport system substrate-binding protein
VDSIRGIEKIDEKTVRVTINSQEDADVQTVLGIFVAPLHHYGSTELYDYENSSFGFTRGDLSAIREKNTTPLGAGRYTLEEYNGNSTVVFKKNKNYYRNCDGGSKVIFEATGNSSESKVHGYFVSYDNYMYFKD